MKMVEVKSNEYVTRCNKCKKILVYTKEETNCYHVWYGWEVTLECPCGNKIIVE